MIVRDGILKTKRCEFGNIVASRKRKLQELYHATVGIDQSRRNDTTLDHKSIRNFSQEAFLDANDISKGRYFDITTILRIGGDLSNDPKSLISSPKDGLAITQQDASQQAEARHVKAQQEVSALLPIVKSSQASTPDDQNVSPSTQRSSRSTQAGTPATHDTLHDGEDGTMIDRPESEESKKERKIIHLSESLLGFDGSPRQETAGGDVDALPYKDLPSPRSNQVGQRESDSEPRSQMSASPNDGEPPNQAPTLQAQPPLLQHEAQVSLPNPLSPVLQSTPDAQLLMEAAQYTKSSSRKSPSPKSRELSRGSPGICLVEDGQASEQVTGEWDSGVEDSNLAVRRKGHSPDQKVVGMARDVPKDLMLSQRPPMRIDTKVTRPVTLHETQTPSSSTPLGSTQAAMQSSPPERMTTRVSSGALRHKSVSEILGETPRSAVHHGDRAPTDSPSQRSKADAGSQTPRYNSLVVSPDSTSFRSRLNELKEREKDRTKLSTVVFARHQHPETSRNAQQGISESSRKDRKSDENKDYLLSLFAAQASAQNPTLNHLITSAHKTLSTENHYIDYHEGQDCRVLKRIYHLQNSNRWSLRQMERSKEPERPTTHWDMLLGEVKWMRTDFREERKWKIAAAKNLAGWCAEWVSGTEDQRLSLQVEVQKIKSQDSIPNNHITPISISNNLGSAHSEKTPDLIPSTEDDFSDTGEDDASQLVVPRTLAPAALFSLAPEDVLFSIEQTPVSDKLLSELPLYQPFEDPRGTKRSYSAMLDDAWRKPIVPVSKYTTGKILLREQGPARRRSRYEYAEEEELDQDSSGRASLTSEPSKEVLSPEKKDVALFDPENKHIIARLHATHAFRPPSEFNMPSQSFFESRRPSEWTLSEDDELRRLVRQYEYNWSLIAACLSTPSLFTSGAERRTPWECFERWVSFEGLPGDMARHQYFRAWNSRREGARQHLDQLYQAQQQANGGVQLQNRRRSAEPVGVERRRSTKYLAVIHGMSKVAKKKESAIQKQQHVASLAAMRKAAEPTQLRQRMQTPREFSAHKYKQESEFKEKQFLYRQQALATQERIAAATHKAAHLSQQTGAGGLQAGRNGIPAALNGVASRLSSLPPNAQASVSRPMPQAAPMMNGMLNNGSPPSNAPLGVRGVGTVPVPQAQMQSYVQGQQRLPSQNGQDHARMISEASRLSEQQRFMQQRQYQSQANGLTGTPPQLASNLNMPSQNNAAMLASLQSAGGKLSPAATNGASQARPSSSPGLANAVQAQQLSSGITPVLNQITGQLKAMNPSASDEWIKTTATASLHQVLRSQNQQANNNSMAINGNMQLSPQQRTALTYTSNTLPHQLYSQIMRSQQASQSRNGGNAAELGGSRPDSRGGGTPQANKSGSLPNGSSQSPRPPQAQMAATGSS